MVPVLEVVPNLSAGRDRVFVERLVEAAAGLGVEVLDASMDPDHNRAVLTIIGPPDAVEDAAVEVARIAVEDIDLRKHSGVHPRIGALDVLPFVPLMGLTIEDARASALRAGEKITNELGVPVFFYGEASDPPGRGLAELRAGGFEALAREFPADRIPDLLPADWPHAGAHPTAGVSCVGARPLLLAWNVEVEGLTEGEVSRLAADLRESGGGFTGLRALGLRLPSNGRFQVSMNLEDVRNHSPFDVFREIENRVQAAGGLVVSTEVVGALPDELVFQAGADRLTLLDRDPSRVLSSRLTAHVMMRAAQETGRLGAVLRAVGGGTPREVRQAIERLESSLNELEL
jgi:glutamate formiminotransferase